MRSLVRRLVAEYRMVPVLVAVAAAFSGLTITRQTILDEAAAWRVAADITGAGAGRPQVLIVVRPRSDEASFGAALEAELTARRAEVVEVVQGDPATVRETFERLAAAGRRLDAVAATPATAGWLVLSDIGTAFPPLGTPRVVVPGSSRWPTFLRRDNLLNIANQIAVIAILAIGMTMVIITGGIDLSVGSLTALASVVATRLIRDQAGGDAATAGGMVLACAVAIAVCGLVGWGSGAVTTLFRVPPFIVTLATMLVAGGLAAILSGGESIHQVPESFVRLGRGADLMGIPNAVLLTAVLYVAAHVLLSRTRLGRYLYAVGGNAEAARLAGVPVGRVVRFAYLASGLLAGLGGVVLASQLKSGSPNYGSMYELYVIAAVVVGGTSLSGGEGRIAGTLVGALIIAVIQNGMNLVGIESYTQKVVLGLVILGAVLLDRLPRGRWTVLTGR
jgi:ribose transport system permease protein